MGRKSRNQGKGAPRAPRSAAESKPTAGAGAAREPSSAGEAPDGEAPILARVVAELRGEGAGDEGHFTVAPEEAARRLAERQLPEPSFYCLLLVQVAVLRGASRVEVSFEPGRARFWFDGAPFTEAELARLYDAALAPDDPGAPLRRSRRLLASAAHAGLGRRYDSLTLCSGAGAASATLRISAGGVAVEPGPAGAETGTTIELHGEERRGWRREEELLHARCQRCDIPVVVGDAAVAVPASLVREEQLSGEGYRGVIGVDALRDDPAAELLLVQHGVVVESIGLRAPKQVVAYVSADHLRTDLSLFRVIRDEALEELRRQVVKAANALRSSGKERRATQRALDEEVEAALGRLERAYSLRRWQLRFGMVALGAILCAIVYHALARPDATPNAKQLIGFFTVVSVTCLCVGLWYFARIPLLFRPLRRLTRATFPPASPLLLRAVKQHAPGEGEGYGHPIQMALRELAASQQGRRRLD